jgi:hypothetical protein
MKNLFILTKQLEFFYGKHFQAILKFTLSLLLIASLVLSLDHKVSAQSITPSEFWLKDSTNEIWFDNISGCFVKNSLVATTWEQCKNYIPEIYLNKESTIREDEILKSVSVLLAVGFICFITYFFWQALAF